MYLSASKAAMNAYARTLANEESDIACFSIRPGVVDTDMQVLIRSTAFGTACQIPWSTQGRQTGPSRQAGSGSCSPGNQGHSFITDASRRHASRGIGCIHVVGRPGVPRPCIACQWNGTTQSRTARIKCQLGPFLSVAGTSADTSTT